MFFYLKWALIITEKDLSTHKNFQKKPKHYKKSAPVLFIPIQSVPSRPHFVRKLWKRPNCNNINWFNAVLVEERGHWPTITSSWSSTSQIDSNESHALF